MVTWGSVPKPEKRKNGREWNRVDKQSQLSPSNPKIPSWPKIPSFVDTPKCPAWRNPLALGHGTAWDHYQMENFLHPTLKYPAAPKIPSSVDTTKYPAWSLFVDIPWLLGHGTAWDHYKIEFFFHPTSKYPAAPKIPSSVDTTKYPAWSLFVDIPWLLGHRTAWDHYKMENYLHPTQKKYPAAPKYPAPSIPVFLSTSLGFWDMGQHGTNGKLPENKSWSLCQHPLALGRPGLKKNVVSLGR